MNVRVAIIAATLLLATRLHAQLTAADVQTVITQAVTRAAQISPDSVIAVVDREGNVLGVWVMRGGQPTDAEVASAVSKAGTAAYLSSDQNAFTSRTAGFIIQQHFPFGVRNTPPGPLVGVGLSNLFFSDINKFRAPGSVISFSPQPGLTIKPVFGSSLDGSPGGVPLYKNGKNVGGLGVVGDGVPGPLITDPASSTTLRSQNPFTFIAGYDKDEDIALAGQSGFAPQRGITADHVYINGIALPYVASSTNAGGTPVLPGNAAAAYPIRDTPPPFPYPTATFGGYPGEIRQPILDDPFPGTINGQARLTAAEVASIIDFAADRARTTRAGIRLPIGTPMAVFITVVANPNRSDASPMCIGAFRTGEATLFSWDVAVQKARTALGFSDNGHAFSTRTVGFLAQTNYPPGLDVQDPGPYYGLQELFSGFKREALPNFVLNPAFAPDKRFPNGITIFPGGFPLYRNGQLIGAIGISGDGVDQDDIVGVSGTHDFLAPINIRADQFGYLGARLPYVKFPRDPNGVGDFYAPTPRISQKLANISTRMMAGDGDATLIGGFIVTGDAQKTVIVRALGPSLAAAGVGSTLANPILELHDATGAVLATNDNWRDSQESAIAATGIAPPNESESAMVLTLDPGAYTAVIHDKTGAQGVGLFEVYDLAPDNNSRLANISTRGFVAGDDGAMIGGFIIGGTAGESRVLLRALGPSLSAIEQTVPSPAVELRDVNGTVITSNAGWQNGDAAELAGANLAPPNESESAIVTSLPSGAYTAIIRDAHGGGGVGLFEVYNLQD